MSPLPYKGRNIINMGTGCALSFQSQPTPPRHQIVINLVYFLM